MIVFDYSKIKARMERREPTKSIAVLPFNAIRIGSKQYHFIDWTEFQLRYDELVVAHGASSAT